MWSPNSAGKRFSSRVSHSSKRRRERHPGLQIEKRSLRFEALEQRTLLTGTVAFAGGILALSPNAGQNDALTIKLDATATHILISDANGNTYTTGIAGASGSGSASLSIPVTSVAGATISVNTLDGTDSLTVDLTNGNPSPDGIINYTSTTGSKQLVVNEKRAGDCRHGVGDEHRDL